MARLCKHGSEIGRLSYLRSEVAVMSDGKMLRKNWDGWKLWKQFKPGVDPVDAFNRRKANLETLRDRLPALADLRTFALREWPSVGTRVQVIAAADMLGDDVDGIWSTLDDAGISEDLETLQTLADLLKWAMREKTEKAGVVVEA